MAAWHGQAGAILEGVSQMAGWDGRYPSTSRLDCKKADGRQVASASGKTGVS